MKVVILAGGLGTRISEESHLKPKPMIEIGERPILWHIMKIYSHYGFHEFVICLGYKGNLIKEFFADYYFHMSDVTFDRTRGNEMTIHNNVAERWKVTLVDTGLQSMTGARLSRVRRYLDDGPFMMTYGDGVGDICIPKLLEFHRKTGRKATLTGIQLGARLGVVDVAPDSDIVRGFQEKPREEGAWINGGFMVLEPSVLDYVHDDSGPFEKVALERLSREGELAIYRHAGFWQCMDTQRDKELLEGYWNSGRAQWKVWGDQA